jgi:hypothetical protein
LSKLDRELLISAGLSPAKAARILGRSRQAVSKGIAGESDYLTPDNLLALKDGVQDAYPENVEPFQDAVGTLFRSLAERLGSSMPDKVGLKATVAAADRLWLILPGYTTGFEKQPAPYIELFQMIDQRRPGQARDSQLEVVAFCDKGRADIEHQFDLSWFNHRQLAVIQCGLVQQMFTPIIVADPHKNGGTACYTLAKSGFEPLDPDIARARVSAFAEHVSEKIRCAEGLRTGRPVNVLTAGPAVLLDAGLANTQI